MEEIIKKIKGLKKAMGCILPSDYPKDDPRSKEEYSNGYYKALGDIEHELFLGYMVLGIKNYPQNPNDYGINREADNPFIMSLETAEKLGQKVTIKMIEECQDEGVRATIVMLANPKEVYFKG